ncbi:MAG: hypothetical protein RMJ51_05465 [Candidatus Calescibacterium sp.]|nr:hypothetical protein [Candidatus Calescibacterium sp.]MCX7972440.1 hypothetical protein [bacterium]MDW8195669.1 hypothetical protein [Candidatus Calescibacterium sp.]
MIYSDPYTSTLNFVPQGDRSLGINPYRLLLDPYKEIPEYKPIEINKKLLREEIQQKLYEYFTKAAGCDQPTKCDPAKLMEIKMNTIKGYTPEFRAIGNMINDSNTKHYVVNGKHSIVLDSDPELAKKLAQETDSIIHDFLKRSSKKLPTKIYIVSEELNINKPHLPFEVGVAKHVREKDRIGMIELIAGEYVDKSGKRIKSLENQDTLSHEVGHVILETLNPEASREVHEAFADSVAFLTQASKEESIRKIIQQNIDLTKTNFISQISENSHYYRQLQEHPFYKDPNDKKDYIRNLAGNYVYDPKEDNPYKKSLSLSSTIYSSWAEYIKYLQSTGLPKEVAIKKANETFKDLLVKTAETPENIDIPKFANSFIQNIKDPILKEIFTKNAIQRKIPINSD